ncbi:MAG: hypothetical protein IJS84_10675 [Spirochaetales bacterium]|nr:hypothetical protein [Spirochaetales bacterium]
MGKRKGTKNKTDIIGTGVIIGILTILLSITMIGITSSLTASGKLSLDRGESAVTLIALLASLIGGISGRLLIKGDKWRIIGVIAAAALIIKATISFIVSAGPSNIWTYPALITGFAIAGVMPIKAKQRKH